MLLLLQFLNSPVQEGIGGLEPDAMERTMVILDQVLEVTDSTVQLPCDADGVAHA